MTAAGMRDRGSHRGQSAGGAHWCTFDGGAHRPSVVSWVRDGLAARQRILWLAAGAPDATVKQLEGVLPEAHAAVRARRVTILRMDRSIPLGGDEVAALVDLIGAEVARATADGLHGLRVVFEMELLAAEGDVARVERVEVALSRLATGACSVLCVYPPASPARLRLVALRSHGTVVESGRQLANAGALEPGDLEAEDLTEVTARRWLEALRLVDEAVEAARQTGERLRGVFDDLPVALLTLDEQGRVLQASEQALWLFGRSGSQVRGAPLHELVDPEQLPLVRESLAEVCAAGDLRDVSLRIPRPEGGARLVELSARLSGGRAGEGGRAGDGGRAGEGGRAAEDAGRGGAKPPEGRDARGPVIRCVLHDVTALRRSRQDLLRQNRELELRHRVARIYLDDTSQKAHVELLRLVLDTVGGRFGLVVRRDGGESMSGWLLGAQPARDPEHVRSLRLPLGGAGGVWARALESGVGVWSNEGERFAGVVPVDRVLVVPAQWRGQCVGAVAVANRAADYAEADCALAEVLAGEAAPALGAWGRRESE